MIILRLTPQMFEILKLRLKGNSGYAIARALKLDPPMVYASLEAARTNFAEAAKMIEELKALGWPEKLEEVEKIMKNGRIEKKRAVQEIPAEEEIAFKTG